MSDVDVLLPIRKGGRAAFPFQISGQIKPPASPGGLQIIGLAGRSETRPGGVVIYNAPGYFELHFWNKLERIEFVARWIGAFFVAGVREVKIDIRAEWFVDAVKRWHVVDEGMFLGGMVEQSGRTSKGLNRLTSVDMAATRDLITCWDTYSIEIPR